LAECGRIALIENNMAARADHDMIRLGTRSPRGPRMSPTPDRTLDPQQIIADLQRANAELQRRLGESNAERDEALERETATAEVLQVINSSPGDLTPVFEAILEKAVRLCEAALGGLSTFTAEGLVTHRAFRGPPEIVDFFLRGRPPNRPGPGTILARLIQGEDRVHVPDATAEEVYKRGDPGRRAMVDLAGARSLVAVALRKNEALLGALSLYRQEVRPFSDKEIGLLANFADQAVIAMENARLITETREALEQQTATAEVLQVINASPGNLAPVFEAMLDKALRLCEAAFGELHTYDGERFETAAVRGASAAYVEARRKIPPTSRVGTGAARILETKRSVHILDLKEGDGYKAGDGGSRTLVGLGGARTAFGVPLLKDETVLGFIMIYRQEIRAFSDKQIAVLENFAAQAVIAIENTRLITETREALEQQTATAEVLGVINSSPGDLAPVFDAMLAKTMRLCDAAHGHLLTCDGDVFHRTAVCGETHFAEYWRQQGSFRPAEGNPLARLLRGERVVHIVDARDDDTYRNVPAYRQVIDLGGIRTSLTVPLRKDGVLLGAIRAYRQEVRPFSDREIALVENFAAQAVIAMENARLLGELRQRTDEVGELNRGLEARVAEQVDELGRVGRLKRFLAPQLAELIVSQGDEKILESHRREIVVVFCDLRGYTAFTETAEPEEVLDFLRQYHGALGPLVSQFEGTLDQFSGDGIMVFFNDPVPCPDPAERAVKMAVAMRSAANTLIADWRERGRDLGFGAGIAQGYATLGQIGFSERSGYTAIGTVCNVAARLCAEAKDGQILLGQRVNVALRGSVATEQLGPLTLKGLSQPVVAYNVPLGAIQPALRVIEGGSPETV
jgi:class 3 adenylate cyclase